MASTITPTNQIIKIEPYSAKLFDFDTSSSRVYLTKTINSLFSVLGENCILNDTLKVVSSEYDDTNDTINITISSGEFIIDSTFIKFPNETHLSLDVSDVEYDHTIGNIIVSLSFQYIQEVLYNAARMKVSYVSTDGDTVIPEIWNNDTDRIVVAQFIFDKIEKTITNITPEFNTEITRTINSNVYTVYPIDNITETFKKIYYKFLFQI